VHSDVTKPILAVGGENLIDYVDRDGVVSALPGGSPLNVAMALGRQGLEVAYVSPISTDDWGDLLADTLTASGVALTGGRQGAPTTMARVTVMGGIPTYRFERDGTAERMVTRDSLAAALPEGTSALHTGSLALTDGADAEIWESFCAEQYERGLVTSLDPNVRLSVIANLDAYRARILRMCSRTHVLKLSDEDLKGLFPEDVPDVALDELLRTSSARVIVLTRGERGCSAWLGDTRIDLPADHTDALVDTVGAGDTFMATLLAGLAAAGVITPGGLDRLDAETLTMILRRAATAATINCTRAGCNPPNRAELDAALNAKA
jgi:fructokinase